MDAAAACAVSASERMSHRSLESIFTSNPSIRNECRGGGKQLRSDCPGARWLLAAAAAASRFQEFIIFKNDCAVLTRGKLSSCVVEETMDPKSS